MRADHWTTHLVVIFGMPVAGFVGMMGAFVHVYGHYFLNPQFWERMF